jgi:ribulose-5-phosphate 4-epimerase/fuculose-1-phosphate aldolase
VKPATATVSNSTTPPFASDVGAARRAVRIDLAAAHRLAFMHGMQEGIFNHLTARVPGTDDCYYQIPFGTHWSEVHASCFMEVGYDGVIRAGEGHVEESALGIHAPIHREVERAEAVFHTHMPFAAALTRLEEPRTSTRCSSRTWKRSRKPC